MAPKKYPPQGGGGLEFDILRVQKLPPGGNFPPRGEAGGSGAGEARGEGEVFPRGKDPRGELCTGGRGIPDAHAFDWNAEFLAKAALEAAPRGEVWKGGLSDIVDTKP